MGIEPGQVIGDSEYCHGPGVRPAHLENKPPDEGGTYRGKSPVAGPVVGWLHER